MATSATTIRLDDELKEKLTKELSATGLSINAYFNMAARQLIIQKKIPSEVLTETDEPTEKTRRALVAAEAKELGIIPGSEERRLGRHGRSRKSIVRQL